MNIEKQYLSVLSDVFHGGSDKTGRNGLTKHRFGKQIKHSFTQGFPLLTTKEVWFKGAAIELLWMLQGRTDLKYLTDNGVNYWTKDYVRSARTDGTLGPVYGHQIRNFNGFDQLKELLTSITQNPNGRRHIINMWNPVDLSKMALPPCHYSFQVNIDGDKMDLLWNQRSCDLFLGVPFDIAMYGLLLQLLAIGLGYTPRHLIGNLGDCHIYEEHFDAVREQLTRKPGKLPTVEVERGLTIIPQVGNIYIPTYDMIKLNNYEPQGKIRATLV